jgi:hypothetical protein
VTVDIGLFDEVAAALRGMVPAELGELHLRAQRYGIKVWFDAEKPGREHYEAQVIGAKHVPGAKVLAIEVGFHSEHPKADDNEAVVARLQAAERSWRKALGTEAEVGPFLGRDTWRRVSETWPDPDLGEDDLAVELALRLLDYVTAIEPVLRSG